MAKKPELVRYHSPFGSPAWMTREQIEPYRVEDDKRYERLAEIDALSEEERRHGPPWIERSS